MGRCDISTLRSLPRIFLPDLDLTVDPPQESYPLPKEEVLKLQRVLRLEEGSEIAVLPNNGTLMRCSFRDKHAWPLSTEFPDTEPKFRLALAQAFPKGDRIDIILRMCTELGVSRFILFPGDRSVVRWEGEKLAEKARRFQAVIRESAEQSFRCRLPELQFVKSFTDLLALEPDAIVLSEFESETKTMRVQGSQATIVVGPEGGWSPRELVLIGDRGATMGRLVMRTDTAGIAAAASLLIPRQMEP